MTVNKLYNDVSSKSCNVTAISRLYQGQPCALNAVLAENRAKSCKITCALFKTNMININRGALIVLEGCDRSGKSTQCKKLVTSLTKHNIPAEMMSFPDRSTTTGKLIAEYLLNKTELNDRTIHLLFSANRWEMYQKMIEKLNSGFTLIIDRYAYSGVAYSAVKPKMEIDWCKQSDAGLPKPDLVFLLTLSSQALAKRPGYGNERYELSATQQRVAEMYKQLTEDSWKIIDADGSVEDVHGILLQNVLNTIKAVKNKPLQTLW